MNFRKPHFLVKYHETWQKSLENVQMLELCLSKIHNLSNKIKYQVAVVGTLIFF